MAQESCNLDKDEAEILKPSSSPPSNPSTTINNPSSSSSSSSSSLASALCLKTPLEFSDENPKCPKISIEVTCTLKAKKDSLPSVKYGNRCNSCRKKVGLTGFRCRCGELFCSMHRHSETHDCSFDYKELGREEISKANPLIRAAKIIKI